jgi:rod shape-determining protein MreC
MYNSDTTPTTGKILFGIIVSLLIIILSRIGVFKDTYSISAGIFKDFQQQNMLFFKGVEQDFAFLGELGNLKNENESLKSQNEILLSEKLSFQLALEESQKISKQLTFNTTVEYIPVRIIKYSENQTEIIINKGSNDGIRENDVLVIEKFLVGMVTEVNGTFSKGRLIISTDLKVPSESKTDGLKGVGVGDGINTVLFQQVPNNKKLTLNDYVVTAGLGGVFPYGLIVGRVIKIESKDADIEQKAQVAMEINLKDLRDIYIIR